MAGELNSGEFANDGIFDGIELFDFWKSICFQWVTISIDNRVGVIYLDSKTSSSVLEFAKLF